MMILIPPKQLILLQGIPGSGKTFWSQHVATALAGDEWTCVILSTDDHRRQECGHYIHDVTQNPAHHAATQRQCVDAMLGETNFIIIDNTNIQKWQAQPYLTLANMYGYDVQAISVQVPLAKALDRNARRDANRRVPDGVIESMYEKLETLF